MIFDYTPWKIDVDIEKTKQFYENNSLVKDAKINESFLKLLTLAQREHFERLGADLSKMDITCKVFEPDEEEEEEFDEVTTEHYNVKFLLCGKLLSIIEFQAEVYSDEEVFGAEMLDKVEVKEDDLNLDIDGMRITFTHPAGSYDDPAYEQWDCGFICGKALLISKKKSHQ